MSAFIAIGLTITLAFGCVVAFVALIKGLIESWNFDWIAFCAFLFGILILFFLAIYFGSIVLENLHEIHYISY